jgi:outer membrane protein OmpA-like peptidoglycan-associated protein
MNLVSRSLISASTVLLMAAPAARGQTPSPAPQTTTSAPAATDDTRPATTTVRGDTGLWVVPTAEVLPSKKWSFGLSRFEADEGQGFSNISSFPLTVGVGLAKRVELFGSWNVVTRIDRDTVPLFFAASSSTGVGGGLLVDYPTGRTPWVSTRGDLWVGGKVNFVSEADRHALAVALRAMLKLPTGNMSAGTSSGKVDTVVDLIASKDVGKQVEVSGYGGMIARGNPAGYTLTNGFRWGFGAGWPSHGRVRLTTELYGEAYSNQTIIAPAGLFGSDGSPVPISTTLKNPVYLNVGVTVQMAHGWFIGAGGNWNLAEGSRANAGAQFAGQGNEATDYQVRVGFHPGVRTYVPPPPPAPAPAPPTPPPAPVPSAPPANRPPTVRASCDPCTVEIGKVATVSADGQDPDGDPLTYQWRAAAGSLTAPTSRQSPWTAPMQVGPVLFTVTVDDGRGGTASDTVTIQVIKPPVKTYAFEDVHFDFDRYTLRPDALRVLDDAVQAMQADATLRLEIEGHTCDIGTVEYNQALGERRANAVHDYFVSRGISRDRLHTISFGEEQPKYDNSREETRRLNRRAALVVNLQGGSER